MDWHSCPSITPPARSDAQGSVTLGSSPACSTLSFSRVRSSSGGAVVFLRLSEGGALLRRENSAIGRTLTVRLRYSAKMERLFPAHLVVRFCCGGQRVRPQFYYAFSCWRFDRCRASLCRVLLLFEENADYGRRDRSNAGHQPDRRSKRPLADRPGGTRLHCHERPLRLSRRTHLLPFSFHDARRARRLFLHAGV